jgi:hypothetical protein
MAKKKKKANLSPAEAFIALPDAEKDRIVAAFDRPFVGETFGPLSPEMRKWIRRAKRKFPDPSPSRQRAGRASKTIASSKRAAPQSKKSTI